MKKPITKRQIRSDIEHQISDFLNNGGQVEQVERGLSGRINPDGPIRADSTAFEQPKASRTYVPEVVAALDSRRQKKLDKTPKASSTRPRKKLIYDDFGEPLRWEWVDK